jgi:transcriptional regulator with XRE-family HTH domain
MSEEQPMARDREPVASPIVEQPASAETGSNAPAKTVRTLELALGVQIRLFRRQHDLSVSDLASAAGISTGMLSKIENGQISPSLATLQAIATALGTPISSLFSNFEDRQDCSFVRAKQGVIIERRGTKSGHVYELLGHALGGAVAVEPFLITLQKDAAPHTGFQHAGVEFIYMLSGEVVYRHAGQLYHLRPGDSLLFDSSALHGPENLLKWPIRYLSVIIYPRNP